MPHSRNSTKRGIARTSNNFQREVNRLSDDVGQLKDDLSGIARDAVGAARAGITEAKRGVHQKLGTARETGAAAADSLKEQVTAHPMTSLGVAAGVGLLVGLFLFRGRS